MRVIVEGERVGHGEGCGEGYGEGCVWGRMEGIEENARRAVLAVGLEPRSSQVESSGVKWRLSEASHRRAQTKEMLGRQTCMRTGMDAWVHGCSRG